MSQSTCPLCKCEDLVAGSLQSTGTVHFRPFSSKFLTFLTADVPVRAFMCGKCGHLTVTADVHKLNRVRDVSKPAARQ